MRVPTHVMVDGRRFSIEVDARHAHSGEYSATEERIWLNPDCKRGLPRVLLHEILHACWDHAGLNNAPKVHKYEEAVVSAMADRLLSTLRANPAIVKFLTADH